MKTGPIVFGIVWWACLVLGCGWSHSALAQGKTDLLLPPAGSLPQGTGNPPRPGTVQKQGTSVPGADIQQTGGTQMKGIVKSRVIARINGSPILEEEVIATSSAMLNEAKKRIAEQYWGQLERELQTKALEDLITEEAIIQDAAIRVPQGVKKLQEVANKEFDKTLRRDKEIVKLKTDDEIKEYLKSQGRSLDIMRRQYIRSFLARQWIMELSRDLIDQSTTRERMLEYYRANPQEFLKKEKVVWQHIYIDVDRYNNAQSARQVAETVWQLVRNARTEDEFNAIVTKYADGISKARSGSGEGNLRGEIKPTELERFVFEQPSGGQGPVVETSRGYHVFRVVEHTPEEMISFEKACLELKRRLEDKVIMGEFMRLSKELRAKAFIEVLSEDTK